FLPLARVVTGRKNRPTRPCKHNCRNRNCQIDDKVDEILSKLNEMSKSARISELSIHKFGITENEVRIFRKVLRQSKYWSNQKQKSQKGKEKSFHGVLSVKKILERAMSVAERLIKARAPTGNSLNKVFEDG